MGFAGKPGAEGLSGLVYETAAAARPADLGKDRSGNVRVAKLDSSERKTPVASRSPAHPQHRNLGLFSRDRLGPDRGRQPRGPSQLEKFPFLPPDLRSHGRACPPTKPAFGYSVNVGTLAGNAGRAQIHGGERGRSGNRKPTGCMAGTARGR